MPQSVISTSEIPITPNGGFDAFYTNSLNTSNPTSSMLFTDQDGSQWGCFTGSPGNVPVIYHIIGMTLTITNPGLAVWSTTDQHNSCALALDKNGFIWMCYDQHVTPMNCYKSAAARNASSMSKVSPLVNSTTEASVTFPVLFKNPVTNELYLTFQKGGGAGGQQYFYHYNAGSTTWEAAAGTTGGQLANYLASSAGATFLSGLPQWDKTTGNLWFAYNVSEAAAPNWNCGGDPGSPCGWYLLGWNGASFIKWDGTAQSLPLTLSNTSPWYTISSGARPDFSVLDSVSIDNSGTIFLPYLDSDASNFLQVYVLVCAHQSPCTRRQLTNNSVTFVPPAPAGWLGPTAGTNGGQNLQSITAVSSGACTYVTYADIFNWGAGQAAYKSCNGFSSSTFLYLTTRFNPNEIVFPDQTRNYTTGAIAFLFQQSNDVQFRFSTLVSTQPILYEIIASPGGTVVNSGVTLSGGTTVQ
jgi:BNR repeat-containing family member